MISPASGKPLLVWCLIFDQFAHVKPVEETLGDRAEFIYDTQWDAQRMLDGAPDILLCVNDFPYGIARCIDTARKQKIPSLVLQDGILEWRCQYENPLFGAGGGAPQHQPVYADKIACIGSQSARQIAAWGNAQKVEVTGMPRLDAFRQLNFPKANRPGRRLLVMTAKKPWFDDRQREITLQSLLDLKNYLDSRAEIEVVWRLTRNVAELIGVENRLNELSSADLARTLAEVDAVVTTVSTTILESMLSGCPVAALDYNNPPRFVQTAWTISAQPHIPAVISELMNPPASKMVFQNDCLSDSLRLDGGASAIVAELIQKMVQWGSEARGSDRPLIYPDRQMIPVGSSLSGGSIGLSELYSDQQVFGNKDLLELQTMLARAQVEITRLNKSIESKKLGQWIERSFKFLGKKLTGGN